MLAVLPTLIILAAYTQGSAQSDRQRDKICRNMPWRVPTLEMIFWEEKIEATFQNNPPEHLYASDCIWHAYLDFLYR